MVGLAQLDEVGPFLRLLVHGGNGGRGGTGTLCVPVVGHPDIHDLVGSHHSLQLRGSGGVQHAGQEVLCLKRERPMLDLVDDNVQALLVI